jgi:Flp pilus assembly protein TadB
MSPLSPVLVVSLAVLAVLVAPGRREPALRWRALRRGSRSTAAKGRQAATSYDVADALVLLSLALRSGMGQQEALERVAALDAGPVAGHLRTVAAALRWGQPACDAWSHVPEAWRPAALAWEVAERAGAAPAQLVEDASWRVRETEDRRLEGAAARAGIRLVLPLGLAFLPAFACTAVVPVVLAIAHTVLGP